jgi:hypothetical protein
MQALCTAREIGLLLRANRLNQTFCGELNVSRRGLHSFTELET